MAGYIRQSTFVDGDTITAALFNNEYNQLVNAFSNTSGHKHDGTTAEGPVIGLIGDAGETSPNNKVLIDTTNNYIEFYVEVSSAPVQQLYIADGAIIPVTDSDIDLGTTSLRFKDTYTDTVTTTGNVSIGGDLTVTGSATISGNLTFGDADTDSINLAAEIDSDIIPNTDGTYDLGSATKEWQDLYIDGTANIDSLIADTADINGGTIDGATIATSDITVGAGKTLDVSSGTLTLADDQISGDKVEGGTIAATTITSLTATSADINGGTIDGTTIATSDITVGTGKTLDVSSGTLTLADNQISGDKVEGGTIAATTITDLTFGSLNDGTITITAFADEDDMSSNSATLVPTQQSVKAYVDSQVTAQDLDFQGDTGGALSIDLDSESLTIAGGTGIDTSGATNTLTVAIDSTVATLTGTQTLTNKTLTTPIISSISNTGTLTLPTSTDTLVGRATTDTLTNKTLTSPDVNTPDIDGGTIDGTVIGGATPAAADFTTMDTTGDASVGGNLSVTGDLTINGTTTTVNSTTVTIDDPIFTLGGDTAPASDDNKDRGIEFKWHNGTAAKVGFFGYDDSASVFTFIPDATNTSEVFSGSAGNVAFGNIAGTLTTAAQPNITSLGTLTALTGGTGDLNWDSGTLFVDSSANAVGIGTTSPADKLDVIVDATGGLKLGTNADAGVTLTSYQGSTNSNVRTIDFNVQNFVVNTGSPTGTTVSEAFRVTNDGNVGIGTSSPGMILDVDGSSAANDIARFSGANSGGLTFRNATANEFIMHTATSDALIFGTNGNTERMRIDASGNVGIGDTSPATKLEILDANGVGLRFGDIASTPSSQTAGYIGMSTSAYSGNNGDLVLIPRTSSASNILLMEGNVGIGASPSYNFHVTGSGDTIAAVTAGATSVAGLNLGNDTNKADGGIRYDNSSDDLIFRAENAEKMRIASSNLLVGKTSSTGVGTGNIEVSNASSATVQIEGGTNEWSMLVSSSADALRFYQDSTERMRIDSSGNVGIGTNNPEAKLEIQDTDLADILVQSTAGTNRNLKISASSSGGGVIGMISNHQLEFHTNDTERMRIDSSGNVGIGTTSPNRKLHLYESTAATSNFIQMTTVATGETGSNGLLVGISSAGQAEIWNYEAQPILFATSGSERMRILSDGDVIIGGTSFEANGALSISPDHDDGAPVIVFDRDSTTATSDVIRFKNSGTTVGSINYNNSSTTYNTSSDARLKDIIGEARGLEVINELNPVSYNWKESGQADEGLIAQEVLDIVPNAVSQNEEDEMYSMDYSKLVVHLVKGMKEQQAQIEALQSEINLLKGE